MTGPIGAAVPVSPVRRDTFVPPPLHPAMAHDERPDEDAPDALRRSRAWAVAALLLLLTAAWLPWWTITISDGQFESGTSQGLWGQGDTGGEASMAWVWVTSGLVALVAAWSFVRIAGRSWLYEPDVWRRDLAIQTVLVVLALASSWLWPERVPFWGGRTYTNATGVAAEASFSAGLGWVLALLAAVAFGIAWQQARSAGSPRS